MTNKQLEITPTERGFLRADFRDRNYQECSIQESSIATESCLWLGVNSGKHLIGDSANEWTKEQLEELGVNCFSRMHLTQEQAKELGKQLAYFARTGKLCTNTEKECRLYFVGHFITEYCLMFYLGTVEALTKKEASIQAYNIYNKKIVIPTLELQLLNKKDLKVESNINIIKWLSEGQQGFYTPNGLVKQLT